MKRRLVLACQACAAIMAVTLPVTLAFVWFVGSWGSLVAMPLNGAISVLIGEAFLDAAWVERRDREVRA